MAEKPLQVESDTMVAHQESAMVEFIGNVQVTQEDIVITAQSIKIFFHTGEDGTRPPSGTGQNQVREIVATDQVSYTSKDQKAFADKAVFTTADQVLILTGNAPKLQTGTSWVTGEKITLYGKEDRVVVESGSRKRVQALFTPQDRTGTP